ncbi:hypothetical protein NP233_g11643 [Leucocoprinus birnbaumii]|uniref:Pseudouridine synthase I TruA alpha/beta domain-containing protein n=1 Tax=Leucocoprinus birnbaumii TaxID=56174 RepID=A0AAD5VIK9_9AGAR|nr:hypothetical protein NP233_g11643 [Leucocoprinus birnbaumii]
MTTNPLPMDYTKLTREQLIERLIVLEGPKPVAAGTVPTLLPSSSDANVPDIRSSKTSAKSKEFDFSNHPKRKIALKFCYSGWEYGGLAFQSGHVTQLPPVENVLFDAMVKARLVDPSVGPDGCGWEKCGRTDKGVSAAGQVVSLWVRSAVDVPEVAPASKETEGRTEMEERTTALEVEEDLGLAPSSRNVDSSKPKNELDYIGILNRILPPTIRILAWAPVATTFSARFSCKHRHYKYFFSSHALDIAAMREAAAKLVGEHDFRNLCKIDAQKQITRFKRDVMRADIEPVDTNFVERGEGMYVFNLVGSAFLYHQVRHIMAILFLIGTKLEKPPLVKKLMNVVRGAEGDEDEEIVEAKPEYQMADALPLMLWDCGYAEEDVQWRSGSFELDSTPSTTEEDTRRSGQGTETDLYHQLHSIWNRSRIYTLLDQHFLRAAETFHRPPPSLLPLSPSKVSVLDRGSDSVYFGVPVNYPVGGGAYKRAVKYVPMMKRNRLDTVDVINERWRTGKGARRAERNGKEGEDDGEE